MTTSLTFYDIDETICKIDKEFNNLYHNRIPGCLGTNCKQEWVPRRVEKKKRIKENKKRYEDKSGIEVI